MQDWDRLVMIGVGVLVGVYTMYQARQPWKKKNWLAVWGLGLLTGAAVVVPIVLAMFS